MSEDFAASFSSVMQVCLRREAEARACDRLVPVLPLMYGPAALRK